MKIVIIGAGAMGCLYGAYLSRKHEVIMLDSFDKQVEAINQNGITVLEEDGTENKFTNVKACISGEYKEAADLVVVFVKSTFTEDALRDNKKLFGDKTLVMTLQNGAGNDRKIAKYVNKKNIIIGTSKHNSVNLGGGKVRHSGSGETTIGSNLENNTNLDKIQAILEESGFKVEKTNDIQRVIWSKLFVNLSINTFTAITRAPIGSMIENKYAWDFAEKMICEAVDVAEAAGTQGYFWEMADTLYTNQADWYYETGDSRTNVYIDLFKNAAPDGDVETFKSVMATDETLEKKINWDINIGKELNKVAATPSFYVNGDYVSIGANDSLDDFYNNIEAKIKEKLAATKNK